MRILRLISLLSLLLFIGTQLPAQGGYGAWEDIQNFFHVFDHGRFEQLEALKVQEYTVGRNFIVYVNNQGQFKLYEDGYDRVLSEARPNFYAVTDYYLVYEVGGQLFVYASRRPRRVAAFLSGYVYGDSLVAFMDANRNLNVFYGGRVRNLEVFDVKDWQVGKNILVYLNNFDEMQVYYAGQKTPLEQFVPQSYKTGRNTLAYVDNYGRFKIFHKGNLIQADPFSPQQYQVGDDMVAFINRNGQFMLFHDGLITELESQPPTKFEVNDAIVAWTLPSQQFKAYYDGRTHELESYIPESWKIDNKVLVYPDYMNKLKALYHGEPVSPAERIANDYELFIDVVVGYVGNTRPSFYWKGRVY